MRLNKIVLTSMAILILSFTSVYAATSDTITLPTSSAFTWVKAKEWLRINLFTFRVSSKASLYNGYSDRRISEMNYAQGQGDTDAITQSLTRYENQKQRALQYAIRANDQAIMKRIRQMTLDQQRQMTQLQLKLESNGELQKNIVRVQKQVAERSQGTVEVVEGKDAADTLEQQTWVVWRDPNADVNGKLPALSDTATLEYAPGTTAGGGGHVYEGGSGHIWAPGTSGGGTGNATNETSTQVIEGDGSGSSSTSSSGSSSDNTAVDTEQNQNQTQNGQN